MFQRVYDVRLGLTVGGFQYPDHFDQDDQGHEDLASRAMAFGISSLDATRGAIRTAER